MSGKGNLRVEKLALDAIVGRSHSGPMAVSFDTLAAAEAMESAGVEPRQARAIAAQLHAAAKAGEAVTRPGLDAALAGLKTELLERIAESERGLLERIAESERGLVDRIAESERGLVDRIAESERRTAALLWRLFGGMAALVGLAVAALRYLP